MGRQIMEKISSCVVGEISSCVVGAEAQKPSGRGAPDISERGQGRPPSGDREWRVQGGKGAACPEAGACLRSTEVAGAEQRATEMRLEK